MLSFLQIAFITLVLYLCAMKYKKRFDAGDHRKLKKNILFVLAHPDDECMFFEPTIQGMQKQANIHILVLSNGGWDGLGKIREKEMERAGKYQGFKDVTVLNDKRTGDNPGKHGQSPLEIWDLDNITLLVSQHIESMKEKGVEIETIVTFDHQGVSFHPNHIATHYGCLRLYLKGLFKGDLYTLETVPMWRKYIVFLDILLSRFDQVNYYLASPFPACTALALHESQFVWYRKLFMGFSKYVYHNGLTYYPEFKNRNDNLAFVSKEETTEAVKSDL